MSPFIISLLCFLLISHASVAFRILVYAPRMMQSHVYFTARIANVLAARGHEVTVIDNVFRFDVDNELSSDIKEILTVEPSPEVTELLKTGSLPTILWNSKASPEEQRAIMEGLGHVHRLQCTHLVKNSTLIPKLRESNFDFAIHEVFDSCGIGILEAAGIRKTVIVSSTGPMDVVPITLGVSETLTTPGLLSDYGSHLSFHEKRRNLKFLSAMINFHEMQEKTIAPLFKTLHGVQKPFGEILRQANLLFYNVHEASDGMRMRGRRSFDIGGIAFKDVKNLTTEYQNLLSDPRPKILVSFGTAATSSHMPHHLKTSLLKAMLQMPDVLFIWKYEIEDEFTRTEAASNVIFKRFMPQTDLLSSGKIALFITHCGQNSLLEAFHAGTRVLAVPLFGDQHRNAKLAEENGLIEIMPKHDIETPSKVMKAVRMGLMRNERLLLTSVTLILIIGRCTFLIYVVFCVPIVITFSFFIFKNGTSLSNPNSEVFFKNFRFGGHRGAPERAPENTIASFEQAKKDGCDLVEFDIHMSSDGVPLLMHDETTGRTGRLDLTVAGATWQQLNSVELKTVNNTNASIPKLSDVIDYCSRNNLKMLFDVKNDNLALITALADQIKSRNLYESVMVSSFNPVIPWRLKKIDPRIITGITLDRSYYSYSDDYRKLPFTRNIFFHWLNEILDEINMIISPLYILPRFLGVDVVMMSYRLISENAVQECKEKGFSVIAWTVNDPDYMRIMAKLDVPFLTDFAHEVDRKIFMKSSK